MKIGKYYFSLIVIGVICIQLTPNSLATPSCNGGTDTSCYHLNLNNAIAGVIGGGDIESYVTYNHDVAESDDITHVSIGTNIGAAVTSGTVTYTTSDVSGCTVASPTTTQSSTTQSFQAWAVWKVTLSGTHCSYIQEVKITGGITPTTVIDPLFVINIDSADSPHTQLTFFCNDTNTNSQAYSPASTNCVTPQIDTHATLCGASTSFGSSTCATPTINAVLSGQAAINICSSHLGQCNGLFINGTINSNIISWPTLNAVLSGTVILDNHACNGITSTCIATSTTLSTPTAISGQAAINICSSHLGQCNGIYINGTLQSVNSGTLNNVLSGTVILDDHACNGITTTCIATSTTLSTPTAISGQAAINICSSHLGQCNGIYINGTQQQNILSWPTLNDVLSGTVVLDNHNCNGITTTCIATSTKLNEQLSGDLNTHQDQACGSVTHCQQDVHQDQACGATITCKSSVNSTTNIANANMTFTSKISNTLQLTPYNMLLIAIAFFAIAAEVRGDALYWFIDIILSLYLLINRPDGSIIPRAVFLGWIFVAIYQVFALLMNKRGNNLSGPDDGSL